MSMLTVKTDITKEEFDVIGIDFATVTPTQLIDNMRDVLPHNDNETWTLFKGSIAIDQKETLKNLGFKDGDIICIRCRVFEG